MADDIVTRLRYAARACNHGFPNGAGDSFPDPTYCGGCLRLNDAADEIERLRAALADRDRWGVRLMEDASNLMMAIPKPFRKLAYLRSQRVREARRG